MSLLRSKIPPLFFYVVELKIQLVCYLIGNKKLCDLDKIYNHIKKKNGYHFVNEIFTFAKFYLKFCEHGVGRGFYTEMNWWNFVVLTNLNWITVILSIRKLILNEFHVSYTFSIKEFKMISAFTKLDTISFPSLLCVFSGYFTMLFLDSSIFNLTF